MALPRAYKTDESFLEKIAIGATGTRFALEDLKRQGHDPIELERGSTSFKIWKAIKIKRVRVPDVLCLRCSHCAESRGKTNVEVSMSHSLSDPNRGWDASLHDQDSVAIVHVAKTGEGPIDWTGDPPVQYAGVGAMREAWKAGLVVQHKPKGAQEGFEIRVSWPSAVAKVAGTVETVSDTWVVYRGADGAGPARRVRLTQGGKPLTPLVAVGDAVAAGQILASVIPITSQNPCGGGATVETYLQLLDSKGVGDRYTATKALGHFHGDQAVAALAERARDGTEHIYVRAEAAAGLMRAGIDLGREFLEATLADEYLENRLEAAIILGEVRTAEATEILVKTLQDPDQHPEIRAGAAWALGEIQAPGSLPALVESFAALDPQIRIEAARALAKLARKVPQEVVEAFPRGGAEERPGIAWALSHAGAISVSDLLPTLVDEDARQWAAYVLGTQDRERMLPEIERLADRDPEVYFAVTVLWKIFASWVFGLEEY
jgi:hypothetical protein